MLPILLALAKAALATVLASKSVAAPPAAVVCVVPSEKTKVVLTLTVFAMTVLALIVLAPVIFPPEPLPTINELATVTSLVRPTIIVFDTVLAATVMLLPGAILSVSVFDVASISEEFALMVAKELAPEPLEI